MRAVPPNPRRTTFAFIQRALGYTPTRVVNKSGSAVSVSGGPGTTVIDLAPSGVTAGTFGDSTHVGQFTVNTNGQVTSASDVAIAFPAATSSYTLITEITPTGTSPLLTISSIPATYRHLELFWIGFDTTTPNASISLQLNGDTGSNYRWSTATVNGTTVAGNSSSSASQINIGLAGNTSSILGSGKISLPYYSSSTFHKGLVGSCQAGDAAAVINSLSSAGWWNNTAAISSISLRTSTAWGTGSLFSLYGVS